MAWGCTTTAVGRPTICARTVVSSGTEALAAFSVASAIPRAIKTRPEKLKTSFQSSIEDFGSSTAILQTAGADVRWLLRASRRVMSVVYSGEREKAMIFCQICARSPPVKAVNKSAAVVNEWGLANVL